MSHINFFFQTSFVLNSATHIQERKQLKSKTLKIEMYRPISFKMQVIPWSFILPNLISLFFLTIFFLGFLNCHF